MIFFQELCKTAGFGQITDWRVVEQQDGVLAIQCCRFLQAPFDAEQFTAVGFGVLFFMIVDVAGADPSMSPQTAMRPSSSDCASV